MLSIIVPVRNESENLKGVFDYFTENVKDFEYEVLLINDFSKDETLKVARELEQKYKNFKILDNKKKRFRWGHKFRDRKSSRRLYCNYDG